MYSIEHMFMYIPRITLSLHPVYGAQKGNNSVTVAPSRKSLTDASRVG